MPALAAVQASAPKATRRLFGNIVGGAIIRLIGAVLLEQNDEYQLQCRYMQLEGMTALATPQIEEVPTLQITPKAA